MALLSSSVVFSASPSFARTPLSQFQQPKQEARQDPKPVSEVSTASAASNASTNSGAPPGKSPATGEIAAPSSEAPGHPAEEANSPHPETSEGLTVGPTTYVATAYSLSGRTASGKPVARGLIAADPSVLPLGTRVRLDAGSYSGEYLVADTGGSLRGRRIDIWTPSSREALRFGRRAVKLTVLSLARRIKRVKNRSRQ